MVAPIGESFASTLPSASITNSPSAQINAQNVDFGPEVTKESTFKTYVSGEGFATVTQDASDNLFAHCLNVENKSCNDSRSENPLANNATTKILEKGFSFISNTVFHRMGGFLPNSIILIYSTLILFLFFYPRWFLRLSSGVSPPSLRY